MLRLFALTAIVIATGCTDEPPPVTAHLHVTWGGQNGDQFEDYGPSTRSGPIVPCPDWGSVDGPVTGLVAHAVVDAYPVDLTLDCQPGGATIDLPAGGGAIAFQEAFQVEGVLGGDGRWVRALALVEDQTTELGFLDLDESLVHPSGGGGCDGDCDDGGGFDL